MMYDMNDLFDSREVVGCKLEQLISNRNYTKSGVCTGAGISRPTLDKILNGEVTNKINFEKHVSKLLTYLSLSPNELMCGIANPYTGAKHLRRAYHFDLTELSKLTELPVEELQKIEAGEDVPLKDLRDVAACLGTGVRGVLGNGYFQTQISTMDLLFPNDPTTIRSPGGFWGHLGILLTGQPKYLWFPITAYTRNLIDQNRTEKYWAIPCMDNSLLIINCANIAALTLLDDVCDQPTDMDWDYSVSNGEIPSVIYEAFDDYMEYKDSDGSPTDFNLSEALATAIDNFVVNKKIDLDKFSSNLYTATILFANGRTQMLPLCDGDSDDLAITVSQIYEMGELPDEDLVEIDTLDGTETLINFKNISMIKLPLALTEDLLAENYRKVMVELED